MLVTEAKRMLRGLYTWWYLAKNRYLGRKLYSKGLPVSLGTHEHP